MKKSLLMFVLGAIPVAAGCSVQAANCDTQRNAYYAAVEAAGECNPAAAEPCTANQNVECPPVGVAPDSVAALQAKRSDYEALGCSFPVYSCPAAVMTPPPYTCQAGADGGFSCFSECEKMYGGNATCVSKSSGCAHLVLSAGYCSGTSMECCSPW